MVATQLPTGSADRPANLRVVLRAADRRRLERRAARVEADRELLRQAVLEARERGASLREIGSAIGMTHAGVGKMLKRPG